jgi:phosphoserine phosphatase
MELVVTLIADSGKEALSKTFVEGMAPSLALSELEVSDIRWLEPGVAADVFVRGELKAVDAAVAAIVADQPVDAVVQPVAGRQKKLLISDMDSTMITVECIDELADFVGKKAEVSLITERAMNGELNFEAALTERVALLKDLPNGVLRQCYEERVTLMPGAKALVATMKAHGAQAILVSGGFTFFTGRVREALGFDEDYANLLEIAHGVLTGRVIPPILGKEAKLRTLQEACREQGIGTAEVMAVGDGANDLPMLMAAGLGVAYRAKPVVRAQAAARIMHCDLSALLYVQGYPKADWRA